MDALQLIRRDHRTIDGLFKAFEKADEDVALRQRLAREIIRELSIHAGIEEQFVYPVLARAGHRAEMLEALEEHHATKVTLDELDAMPAASERFAPKMALLIGNVRAHIEEEERTLLPQLERALDGADRQELGRTLETARRAAPTRPHPAAPDMPPANFVANALAAVMDRSRDAMRGGLEMLRGMGSRTVTTGIRALARIVERGQRRATRAGAEVRDAGREGLAQVRDLPRELLGEFDERREQGRRALQESARDVARALDGNTSRRSGRRSARARGKGARTPPPNRKQARSGAAHTTH